MVNNIFLTGAPKCGKSTIIEKVIWQLKREGWKIGGILTPERRVLGKRAGFAVINLLTGEEGTLASIEGYGPKVSKYHVHVKGFEVIAIDALKQAMKCDLIVIDEIGRMEFFSEEFEKILQEILKSKKPLLAALHRDYVDSYAPYGEVIVITPSNRNVIVESIIEKVRALRK